MRLTAGCFGRLNMTRKIFEFYRLNHQADNLAKLWLGFLPVTELIAKIFGAVSRTISLMRLSALLASKRCRCHNDGFCSDEEQENALWGATLTYCAYVGCDPQGVAAVIRCLAQFVKVR